MFYLDRIQMLTYNKAFYLYASIHLYIILYLLCFIRWINPYNKHYSQVNLKQCKEWLYIDLFTSNRSTEHTCTQWHVPNVIHSHARVTSYSNIKVKCCRCLHFWLYLLYYIYYFICLLVSEGSKSVCVHTSVFY